MDKEKAIIQIIEQTGLEKKEIQKLVKGKIEEFKGLISEEGALFVVAKELEVELEVKGKEPESDNWMEDLANVEIGSFEKDEELLKIAKGYNYTFKMLDSRKKPAEVKDVFKGVEQKQVKYQFWVKLIGVAPSKKAYAEILKDEKPFIFEWVNALVKGKDYKWKISKSAAKQFAQFCLDEQINDDSIIRYTRFGESGTTTYEFKKLGKTE